MSRFIKKSIVFLVILSLILVYINKLYIDTDAYKSMNSTEKFDHVPDEIEIANLGTSHAQYAFLYDDVDKVSFNFAMPAQRIYYDEKILKKYIGNFKEGATLFIPISYVTPYLGYDDDNFKQYNNIYYEILSFNDIKNSSVSNYIKYGLLPILTSDSNIKYLFIDDKKEYVAWDMKDRNDKTMSKEKMIEESKETFNRHLNFIRSGEKQKEEKMQILDEILKTCIENNIRPVVTTTPLTRYYSDNFSEEFLNEFIGSIENIVARYPNVKYLDYSKDERFTDNDEYFFDSSHLNVKGAKLFTDIILGDIKKDLD